MSLDLITLVSAFEPATEPLISAVREQMKQVDVNEVLLLVERGALWSTTVWLGTGRGHVLSMEPLARAMSMQGLVFAEGSWPHASLWEAWFFNGGELVDCDQRGSALRRGWERVLGRTLSDDEFYDVENRREIVTALGITREGVQALPLEWPSPRLAPAFLFDAEVREPTPAELNWELDHSAAVARHEVFWAHALPQSLRDLFPLRSGPISLEFVAVEPAPLIGASIVFRTVRWNETHTRIEDVVEQSCLCLPRVTLYDGRFTSKDGTQCWWTLKAQEHNERRVRTIVDRLCTQAIAQMKAWRSDETPTPAELVFGER